MVFGSVQKIIPLESQSKFQMFTLFTGRSIGGPTEGTSTWRLHTISSIYSFSTELWFWRISQRWDNAHTLNLENCLLYLSSIMSQFLDFIYCMVFDFILYCVKMSRNLTKIVWRVWKSSAFSSVCMWKPFWMWSDVWCQLNQCSWE